MKAPVFFAAALLALGLGTSAFAQTTPAASAPSNDTNPMAPSNNQPVVRTTADGANVANNRDRLSPGTGTPAPPARTEAERQAHRDQRAAKRASKSKMKTH